MDRRLELQSKLEELLCSKSVYFQPPSSVRLKYPCIIYSLSDIDVKRTNNHLYLSKKSYTVTIIDEDPDSVIPDKIFELPLCRFDRFYTVDNLNHWVFNLYY